MTKFAFPLAIVASAIVLSAATVPGVAKAADVQRTLPVSVKEQNGQTVYCVQEAAPTGSLIPQNICRTRAEWIEAGATFRTTARLAMNEKTPAPVRQN